MTLNKSASTSPYRRWWLRLSLVVMAGGALFAWASPLVLQKIATELALPYGWTWLAATVLCCFAWRRRERQLFVGSLFVWSLIYLGGNGLLADFVARSLQRDYVAQNPLEESPLDAIVLLGGGTTARPNGQPQLSAAGDRVMLAAQMYHAGKTRLIVCTGSRIAELDRTGQDPGPITVQLLERVGVPPECLSTSEGRTTAEEMRALAGRWTPDQRVGLITSAFHMPRALCLARLQGLRPIPLAADFRTPADPHPTVLDFIPSARAAEQIRLVAIEWLARLVGR